MPILAGKYEHGHEDGPRIYPVDWHRSLYRWSWQRAHPDEFYPSAGEARRPYFYFF